MPVVDKQNPNQTIKGLTGSLEDRIQSVKEIKRPGMRVSLYGRPKTGKTRLISTFPKPVFIMGSEDGTDSISNVDDVKFVLLRKSTEVSEYVQIANRKGYNTIAMDNCTQFQSMILAEMLGLEKVPIQHERGVMASIDNQEYSKRTKDGLASLLDFKGNIIFTAHEKNFNEDNVTQSDLILPTYTSFLSKAVANWLNGICDYVCQTFIRQEMKEQDIGDGIISTLPTGKGEYCLRVGPHPIFWTGFRVPTNVVLPDVIVNPTYAKMREVIEGRYKEKK